MGWGGRVGGGGVGVVGWVEVGVVEWVVVGWGWIGLGVVEWLVVGWGYSTVDLMKDLKYEHQSIFPLLGRVKLNFRDR